MGGINHKPTRKKFAVLSALLSKKVTEAFVATHMANIMIEHVLIASSNEGDYLIPKEVRNQINDLAKAQFYLSEAIRQLEEALKGLEEVDEMYDLLIDALAQDGYQGNPLAPRIYDLHLREQFDGTIILPHLLVDVWDEIASKIEAENLPATFQFEQSLFRNLQPLIYDLLDVLKRAREVVGSGQFIEALESNTLPLRTYFARVFSYLYYVMTTFLYSTLISTELFYQSEGLPSLVEPLHQAQPQMA